jgi:uncharacterized membrane protein (TIGR02234 family)
VLVLVADGRVWGSAVVRGATGAQVHVAVTGHAVGDVRPLGIALFALAAAILAVRGALRVIVGVLVVLDGVVTVIVALHARGQVAHALATRAFGVAQERIAVPVSGWSLVCVAGGVLAALAGVAVLARGRQWPALGSRYDAPAARPRVTDAPAAAWDALDRGEDPTV